MQPTGPFLSCKPCFCSRYSEYVVSLFLGEKAFGMAPKYINDPSLMFDLHWIDPDRSAEQKPQQQVDNQPKIKQQRYNLNTNKCYCP